MWTPHHVLNTAKFEWKKIFNPPFLPSFYASVYITNNYYNFKIKTTKTSGFKREITIKSD